MTISKNVLAKYKYNDSFIETGTSNGDTVQLAIELGFKQIISIEFYENKYNNALHRFKNNNNILLFNGDSGKLLSKALRCANTPSTIWLDSHYSQDSMTPVNCTDPCPILKELDQIIEHWKQTNFKHTILIDDMRLFIKGVPTWNNITYINILDKLKSGFGDKFTLSNENGYSPGDILVIKLK